MSLMIYLGVTAIWAVISMAGSVLVMWYLYPHVLLKAMFRFLLYSTGLRLKSVNVGPYRYCYAERGKPSKDKSSLMLIHGFSASKDMWINIVKRLPKDTHVIVPDLLGHGDTSIPPPGAQIDLPYFADSLYEFASTIGLAKTKFHLAGASLGGSIVAMYASKYPDTLECVTLMCPAIQTPVENEFMREVKLGHCRLIPDTPENLQKMLNSCYYKKPKVPKQFLKGALNLRLPKNDFLHRLFLELCKEIDGNLINDTVDKINTPTQVIWGENDELVDVSGLEWLQSRLPNCVRTDKIDRCGHSMNMERPDYVIKYLLSFRDDYA